METLQDIVSEIKKEKRSRSEFKEEEEKERQNIITEKYTGRLYPCKSCGLEKVKERTSGYIPDFCHSCQKKISILKMKEARLEKAKEKIFNKTIDIIMPDGSTAKVRDSEEENFIKQRLIQYKKDFDWTESADLGLLTKLINLELQTNRISKMLTLRYKNADAKSLAALTEEYRKCQSDLGINRTKRVDSNEAEDPAKIVMNMIAKFREYKQKFPERFQWRCKKCGEINSLEMENPDAGKSV